VAGKRSQLTKCLVTSLTLVGSLSAVDAFVLVEGSLLRERLRTHIALVWFVSRVNSYMHDKLSTITEALPAGFTDMRLGWFQTAVSLTPFVFAQTPLQRKHFVAQVTLVRFRVGMNSLMLLQCERILQQFVADIALVRAVGRMSVFMLCKTRGVPKRFVTLVTFVRLVTSMRSFVRLQVMRLTECFLTAVTLVRSFLAVSTTVCSKLADPSECLVANTTDVWLFIGMDTFMLH